jgi:hypothetical protein
MHTTSAAGSYSRLNCRCTPGYSCTYYKRIQAIITLNSTAYDFNNNVGGVRTAFIAAMAAAANVSTQYVSINGVVARTAALGSRRLLSVASRLQPAELSIEEEFAALPKRDREFGLPEPTTDDIMRAAERPAGNARNLLSVSGAGAPPEETIKVYATVSGAGRLNHLERHLVSHKPGLFISHRWERHQTVQADKAA